MCHFGFFFNLFFTFTVLGYLTVAMKALLVEFMTEFPHSLHFSLYTFPFIACSHGICVKTETFSGLTTIFRNFLELSTQLWGRMERKTQDDVDPGWLNELLSSNTVSPGCLCMMCFITHLQHRRCDSCPMRRLFVGTIALMEATSWVICLPDTMDTFWLYVRDGCMSHILNAYKFEEWRGSNVYWCKFCLTIEAVLPPKLNMHVCLSARDALWEMQRILKCYMKIHCCLFLNTLEVWARLKCMQRCNLCHQQCFTPNKQTERWRQMDSSQQKAAFEEWNW